MKVISEQKGEAFPHRTLWNCAVLQYQTARDVQKGSKYFDTAAMLMAYLAYEAYLNFIGDRLDPKTWEQERKFFNTREYSGIEGKLKCIIELCSTIQVDKGKPPYQTIKQLSKFRDNIIHAKVLKYTGSIEHHIDHEPDLWPRDSFEYVTKEKTEKVINDVEGCIEYLHKSLRSKIDGVWFGDKSLKGITGHASSSTRPKSKESS